MVGPFPETFPISQRGWKLYMPWIWGINMRLRCVSSESYTFSFSNLVPVQLLWHFVHDFIPTTTKSSSSSPAWRRQLANNLHGLLPYALRTRSYLRSRFSIAWQEAKTTSFRQIQRGKLSLTILVVPRSMMVIGISYQKLERLINFRRAPRTRKKLRLYWLPSSNNARLLWLSSQIRAQYHRYRR